MIIERLQAVLFFTILIYMVFFMNRYVNRIKTEPIKRVLKKMIYLQYIFYPLIFLERFPFTLRYLPYGLAAYPLFYFFCNIFWLIFISNYLYFPEIQIDDHKDALESFCHIYGISPREAEIIEQLIKGESYKKTAHTLFISFETVKSHINNIYKKAGINSKVKLMELIQKCEK